MRLMVFSQILAMLIGALMGVVSAVLKFVGVEWFMADWAASKSAEWLGLAMYIALIIYMAWHTMKAKKEK